MKEKERLKENKKKDLGQNIYQALKGEARRDSILHEHNAEMWQGGSEKQQ